MIDSLGNRSFFRYLFLKEQQIFDNISAEQTTKIEDWISI